MTATKERKRKKAEENGHDEDSTATTTRTKQGRLAGMEPETIPEIEDAAENFVKARNKWQRAHQPMIEAHEILHALLKKHGLRHYEFDDTLVDVVGSEKVRVKARKDDDTEE